MSDRIIPKGMERLYAFDKSLKRVVAIILLFVLVNFVLYSGQKLSHLDDQRRLDEIKRILDSERTQIESLDISLREKERRINEMKEKIYLLNVGIAVMEGTYPNGMPPDVYVNYSQQIQEHNVISTQYNFEIKTFRVSSNDYSLRIRKYNTLVQEGNGLAKEVSGFWVVVPGFKAFKP